MKKPNRLLGIQINADCKILKYNDKLKIDTNLKFNVLAKSLGICSFTPLFYSQMACWKYVLPPRKLNFTFIFSKWQFFMVSYQKVDLIFFFVRLHKCDRFFLIHPDINEMIYHAGLTSKGSKNHNWISLSLQWQFRQAFIFFWQCISLAFTSKRPEPRPVWETRFFVRNILRSFWSGSWRSSIQLQKK